MKQFTKLSGFATLLLLLGLQSCEEQVVETNVLSVDPSAPVVFKASGNEDVIFTVSTNAGEWDYSVPDWIVATKEGNTLAVNVNDNETTDSYAGRITFTAGNAEPVNVSVAQESVTGETDLPPVAAVSGTVKDVKGEQNVSFALGNVTSVTTELVFSISEALDEPVSVEVYIDDEYLKEYDYINRTSSVLVPESAVITPSWTIAVQPGETEARLSVTVNGATFDYGTSYLLPLAANVVSGNVTLEKSSSRVNYTIKRNETKALKQLVCFEINDANPLNALEVLLDDGSYFFDAVVLFSGNIAWDDNVQAVRFNARTGEDPCNPNISALIAEPEKYLKPLHDAGIKVYMGIMPHHTPAAIHTLSYEGCKAFAEEMAQIVKDCYLDGVFLDNEYYGGDTYGVPTPWWTEPVAGAAYFAYQMSKQMDLVCDWETDVVVFEYGLSCNASVTDHEDNSVHTPDEFVDLVVPNYNTVGLLPYDGMTRKECVYASKELNRGDGTIDASTVETAMEREYGWLMWFAYNPDPNSSTSNRNSSINQFDEVAMEAYGMGVQSVTHYYTKPGKGQYDDTRYSLYD